MSGGLSDHVCDVCTSGTDYPDLCLVCFTAEVSEMTIKEMRTVGSALGVKFCGKTLKADLRNILVSSKVEQVQEIKPALREPTCLRGGDQCFQENVLRMTIKEIRKVQ